MIETPVRPSPAMIARSIGAAPRQRGSSEGWTLRISCSESSGSLISAPKAHTTTARGRAWVIAALASGSLTFCGCSSAIPRERALAATGGDVRRRPRPLGRSGRVITSAGRWASLRASRSSTAAANSEVPMKTVLKALARRLR